MGPSNILVDNDGVKKVENHCSRSWVTLERLNALHCEMHYSMQYTVNLGNIILYNYSTNNSIVVC